MYFCDLDYYNKLGRQKERHTAGSPTSCVQDAPQACLATSPKAQGREQMDTQTSSRDRVWGSRALLLCVQGHHSYQASPKAQDVFLQGELTVDVSWRWEKQGRWACGPPESCSPLRVRCCFSPTYQP